MAVEASHHPAKFCGHRYCGNGDIMVLVSHVILQLHATKVWINVMGRGPSWQVTSLVWVAIGTVVVEI